MQLLSVCLGCGRHVRRAERVCPFCATARAPDGPDRSVDEPVLRRSRSAMLLAGAAIVAGCQAQRLTPDAAPSPDAAMEAPRPAYGAPVAPIYGGPVPPPEAPPAPPDAAVADAPAAPRARRRVETRTPRRRETMPVPAYGVAPRETVPLKR
jgi:hypothetical protein